jgi:hypothetical protein
MNPDERPPDAKPTPPQPEPEVAGPRGELQGALARTEGLADRAIRALREDAVHLPDLRAELGKAGAFLSGIHSRYLWAVIVFGGATAPVGVGMVVTGVEPIGRLPDWYMHLFMYLVIACFTVLYIKADMLRRRFRRFLSLLLTLGLSAYYAWVLWDLVPARKIAVASGDGAEERWTAVMREEMPGLKVPALMLCAFGVLLLLHWLVLTRYRDRRAGLATEEARRAALG